ncbi:MAG: hypothetical protein IJ572_05085 [Bacilli bacterium]|nr:hypothetical protein [Bacilli bacterium]
MEIILDNVSYSSNKLEESLNSINYTFKNSITFVSGLRASIIKELLFQEKKSNKGYVYLSSRASIYDVAYLNNNPTFNNNSLYEEMSYLNKLYKLNYSDFDKRVNDALKMANLSLDYLSKTFDKMSINELKKSKLAVALFLNPKIIILDYFEKNMSNKEIEYLKKLVNKLNKMYNKNIIIFSNDIEVFINIIKDIIIFNSGNIVFNGTSKDLYNKELYKYIDEPNIISIINYLNSKKHKFDKYIDIKELLKAIYRDVENK